MRDELIRAVRTRFEPDRLYLTWPAVAGVSASERLARQVSLRWERAADVLLESLRRIEGQHEDHPPSGETTGSRRRRKPPAGPHPRAAGKRRGASGPGRSRAAHPRESPAESAETSSRRGRAPRRAPSARPARGTGNALPPWSSSGGEARENPAGPDGGRAAPLRPPEDPEAGGPTSTRERSAARTPPARRLPRGNGRGLPAERARARRFELPADATSEGERLPVSAPDASSVARVRESLPGPRSVPGRKAAWPGDLEGAAAWRGSLPGSGPDLPGETPPTRLPAETPPPAGSDTEARITERLRREAALKEWEATGF
jgi:hypothetical protein